jgi:hypothetical protein
VGLTALAVAALVPDGHFASPQTQQEASSDSEFAEAIAGTDTSSMAPGAVVRSASTSYWLLTVKDDKPGYDNQYYRVEVWAGDNSTVHSHCIAYPAAHSHAIYGCRVYHGSSSNYATGQGTVYTTGYIDTNSQGLPIACDSLPNWGVGGYHNVGHSDRTVPTKKVPAC